MIDRLDALRPGVPSFVPDRVDKDGRAVFDKVSEGQVILNGHIIRNGAGDDWYKKISLRVFANGFLQIPAEVKPPAAGTAECKFTATVLLTRPTDNHIDVQVIGLPSADGPGRRMSRQPMHRPDRRPTPPPRGDRR